MVGVGCITQICVANICNKYWAVVGLGNSLVNYILYIQLIFMTRLLKKCPYNVRTFFFLIAESFIGFYKHVKEYNLELYNSNYDLLKKRIAKEQNKKHEWRVGLDIPVILFFKYYCLLFFCVPVFLRGLILNYTTINYYLFLVL